MTVAPDRIPATQQAIAYLVFALISPLGMGTPASRGLPPVTAA